MKRLGQILSGVAIAVLLVDAAGKLLLLPPYVAATVALGYRTDHVLLFGAIEAVSLAVYVLPRTAALGCVLWTGWLGGAVATHLRLGQPMATHVLFPLYVAALLWGGLYLRQPWIGRIAGLGPKENR
jgi:hypothetical protein